MKIASLAALLTIALVAQAKSYDGYTYPNMQYVEVNLRNNNSGKVRGEMYNYTTGGYSDVELKPNNKGGLKGEGYDYQTGKYQDIEIDSTGDVEVYEW